MASIVDLRSRALEVQRFINEALENMSENDRKQTGHRWKGSHCVDVEISLLSESEEMTVSVEGGGLVLEAWLEEKLQDAGLQDIEVYCAQPD